MSREERKLSKAIKKQSVKYTLKDQCGEKEYNKETWENFKKSYVAIRWAKEVNKLYLATFNKYIARQYYYWDWTLQRDQNYISKKYFDTLTKIDDKYHKILYEFGFVLVNTEDQGEYTDQAGLDFIENIKKEHKPFVIKGTDWPYWFKVNDKLIKSKTSNYFMHLYNAYNILEEGLMEEYTGPDKYEEHKKGE